MTNDQLRAFTAVVEQGSFRAAAEYLHKTQPTISAAVRTLEREFSFLLFNREGYRPTMTIEGKAFYRQAKQLLSQAQQLEQLGHAPSQRALPTLSICLNAVYAKPSDLESIHHFCIQNPDITLNISSAHLHGTVTELDQENVDLAIGARYGLDDRHDFFELSTIEMITVASPSCKALSAHKTIKPSVLYQYPHILTSSSSLHPTEHINVLPNQESLADCRNGMGPNTQTHDRRKITQW